MARAQGARSLLAGVFESTYGTTPGSGFISLPFVRDGLASRQPLVEEDVLGQGRDPLAPGRDVEDVTGDIVVPVDAVAIGAWLKATFGAPTTTGSGPYTHVFNSGGWALPSLSLERGLPEVPHYFMRKGCKVDRAAFSFSRSGWAAATFTMRAQTETKATSTGAGTPTEYTYSRFLQRQSTATRAASAVGNVVSAELTYMNNLDVIDVVGNGGLIAGADPSMASLSGRVRMRYADTTMFDQALADTSAVFTFGYDDGTNSLVFSIPRTFLARPEIAVEGPRGIEATFDLVGAQQTNGDPMLTATLINGQSSY